MSIQPIQTDRQIEYDFILLLKLSILSLDVTEIFRLSFGWIFDDMDIFRYYLTSPKMDEIIIKYKNKTERKVLGKVKISMFFFSVF